MTTAALTFDEGRNCMALERAGRIAFLQDGESYFPVLADAIENARRSVLIVGWAIDCWSTCGRTSHEGRSCWETSTSGGPSAGSSESCAGGSAAPAVTGPFLPGCLCWRWTGSGCRLPSPSARSGFTEGPLRERHRIIYRSPRWSGCGTIDAPFRELRLVPSSLVAGRSGLLRRVKRSVRT